MRKIRCDPRSVDNIVERELIDQWAGLEEERERLSEAMSAMMWIFELSLSKELPTWPIPPEAPRTTR